MKRNESNEDIRRRINIKNSIVVKCVLQLLMIELLNELFENEDLPTVSLTRKPLELQIVGEIVRIFS